MQVQSATLPTTLNRCCIDLYWYIVLIHKTLIKKYSRRQQYSSTPAAYLITRYSCTSLNGFSDKTARTEQLLPTNHITKASTHTLCPIWFRQSAAASPAGPDPTTATFIPVRCDGMRGTTHPSSNALSMMEYSILLIVTGESMRPATQAPSHGAGHTRPVNSGKLFVCRE